GNTSFSLAVVRVRGKLQTQLQYESLIERARAREAEGNLAEARELVHEALRMNPLDTDAREYISRLETQINTAPAGPTTVAITDSEELIRERKRSAPAGYIYIPGGTYRIGSDSGPESSRPERIVRVDGFYIGET